MIKRISWKFVQWVQMTQETHTLLKILLLGGYDYPLVNFQGEITF